MKKFNPKILSLSEKLTEYVVEWIEVKHIHNLTELKLEVMSKEEVEGTPIVGK